MSGYGEPERESKSYFVFVVRDTYATAIYWMTCIAVGAIVGWILGA